MRNLKPKLPFHYSNTYPQTSPPISFLDSNVLLFSCMFSLRSGNCCPTIFSSNLRGSAGYCSSVGNIWCVIAIMSAIQHPTSLADNAPIHFIYVKNSRFLPKVRKIVRSRMFIDPGSQPYRRNNLQTRFTCHSSKPSGNSVSRIT